jgi:SAM-dependent methyltransferase
MTTQTAVEQPALAFTGERFTPECVREMYYEHYARYAMAASIMRQFTARTGRKPRVLDAACGEGYGSAMLAPLADSVLGLDVDLQAIAHAQTRYSQGNLSFQLADVAALATEIGSFDIVTSFETLEHLHAHDEMLAGFKKVLASNGLLLLSSPDKHSYTDLTGYQNPFHVRELYRHEFETLLYRYFSSFRLFGQRLLFQSAIWDLATPNWHAVAQTSDQSQLMPSLDYLPLYFIALTGNNPEIVAAHAGQLHLFGDKSESIYNHYNSEIRNGIFAGARIADMQAQINFLKTELDATRAKLAG